MSNSNVEWTSPSCTHCGAPIDTGRILKYDGYGRPVEVQCSYCGATLVSSSSFGLYEPSVDRFSPYGSCSIRDGTGIAKSSGDFPRYVDFSRRY